MNRFFPTPRALVSALIFVCLGSALAAAEKREARVTEMVRQVEVLPARNAPRSAVLNEIVRDGSAVRTGNGSRAELTFPDLTITRLGADSFFSFDRSGRSLDVQNGALLLRVPKNSGGARIKSNTLTVAITGTTVLFETHPRGVSKVIFLEGGGKGFLTKYPSQSVVLRAGQMIVISEGATRFGKVLNVDLRKVMKGYLITKFPPLPSLPLIQAAIANQQNALAAGQLFDPNTNQPQDLTGMEARDQAAAARPLPTRPPNRGN